jgi:non-heme chloroperoxidase
MVTSAVFDTLLASWDLRGLRLVIPDLRGTGRSDRPESGYALDDYAGDVMAIADQEGLERFVLIGHSAAGQLAQYLAARHPERVRGLVVMTAVPAGGFPFPPELAALFRNAGGSREDLGKIVDMVSVALPAAERERLLDGACEIPPACIAQWFDAWSTGGFAGELDAITAPTLVLATDDPVVTPALLNEHIVGKIRNARLVTLPGCGHYVQCERPRELAAVLDAFLCGLS